MTPTEFITAARRKYNSVGDTFFADAEILDLLYQAEMEMAIEALTIEASDTSITTVSGTRSYSFPTRFTSFKRVLYDGERLDKISFRDDDEITFREEDTADTGQPIYYLVFGDTLYLRPTPDAAKTVTLYGYKEPAIITVSDSIETPTRYHMMLTDGVVAEMCYKDENYLMGDRYKDTFMKHIEKAKAWQRKRNESDSFGHVRNDDAGLGSL